MKLRYTECPRDSWQGFATAVPSDEKRRYVRALLAAGFRYLDLGSFVSPRAVPQMADTEALLSGLARPADAVFSCVIANEAGLERATHTQTTQVGFPLSVNETFQLRNTRQSLAAAWTLLERLQAGAQAAGLGLTVYLSMGFGNPYGDPWSADDTAEALERVRRAGVQSVVLADTVGTATPERVRAVLERTADPSVGLHLHAQPDAWRGAVEVALAYGVRWLEGALGGVGGCPFAEPDREGGRTGNLPSEALLLWLAAQGYDTGVDLGALAPLAAQAVALQGRYDSSRVP